MLHLSEGKIKVISPRSFNFFNIRFINYIINIFSTAKVISKLKSKNTYFIIWDYLPDSVLPIIFSRIPRKNIIVDLEEKIQNDPEASWLFKLFEFFVENKISGNYFVSNKYLVKKTDRKVVLPGFFLKILKKRILLQRN